MPEKNVPDSELIWRLLFAVNPLSPFNWIVYVVFILIAKFTLPAALSSNTRLAIGVLMACFCSATFGYSLFIEAVHAVEGSEPGAKSLLSFVKS